ncbi:hypothetical protein G7Z17_g10734 [Cylindrodendrum hubeiense]|uniref:Uncharacterized protein n=1 Tax=Cylindrodendrum hubeiense TaxID=595255 RepID=A0A9P5H272_9HYPO|nr:hypothetical protein G7Z17_g10734 [Cylindrodendrum hubeiense]
MQASITFPASIHQLPRTASSARTSLLDALLRLWGFIDIFQSLFDTLRNLWLPILRRAHTLHRLWGDVDTFQSLLDTHLALILDVPWHLKISPGGKPQHRLRLGPPGQLRGGRFALAAGVIIVLLVALVLILDIPA